MKNQNLRKLWKIEQSNYWIRHEAVSVRPSDGIIKRPIGLVWVLTEACLQKIINLGAIWFFELNWDNTSPI